jgi:hypothetical protein
LAHAHRNLPATVQLMAGNASEASIEPLSQGVVLHLPSSHHQCLTIASRRFDRLVFWASVGVVS